MKTVKLGDVCEFKPKKSEAKTKLDGKDLVSFAPMEMLPINQKYFGSTEEKPLEKVYSSYTYFQDNDVIYAKITPCFENGKLSIAKGLKNGIGFGSSEFVPIRCSENILPEYLYYFLLNPSFIRNGVPVMHGASGHRRVPNEYTENLEIELPSLEEQQRVVEKLDAAFERISAAEVLMRRNLDNVAALQKSILHKYLGASDNTHTHRLAEICRKIFAGGDVPKGHVSKVKTERYSVPIFTNGEKNDGLYGYTDEARVFEPSVTVSARGTIGFSLVRHEDFYPAVRLIVLTPNDEIADVNYLGLVIKAMDFTNTGTSIPQLTVPMIKQYEVALPSLDTQKEIVKKLGDAFSKSHKLELQYTKKLAKLTALRESLLSQAFSTTK